MSHLNVSCRTLCRFLLALCLALPAVSCHKETVYEGRAELRFSASVVCFDTVFTSLSSVTERLVVSNPYKGDVYTDIVLQGGNSSYFSVNVNGVPGASLKNVCIPAEDSIFVFIKVNIFPNGQDTPLLVVDSLHFLTNGTRQHVSLLAYGQDAHFIVADSKVGSIPYKIVAGEGEHTVWKNDKPYVIYGYAVVDSTGKLEIEEGTQVYIHKNGGLWVYKGGCLKVKGTKEAPVVFQGDRREAFFQKDYNQWSRIWINEGTEDNEIQYAVIRNAFIGIQAEVLDGDMGNRLVLSNTLIEKSSGIGFLGRGYRVLAYNNVLSDCGQYALALVQGGSYTFVHNTVYNEYSLGVRNTPSVFFSNYYDVGNYRYIGDFEADFTNNILYGNLAREFAYSFHPEAAFQARIHDGLLRCDTVYPDVFGSNLLRDRMPLLEAPRSGKFTLQASSPCIARGVYLSAYPYDRAGNPRPNPPAFGAYEYTSTP
ncbi:MAG: hypothetical protein J5873_04860 [Bacteroidales bacterium]|nr:hypothetical protein [Bacteroidales bacterium]